MRQKSVKPLTVLKGQEYENACRELSRKLSSDLLKRGTHVTVNGDTYKLTNKSVRDIKAYRDDRSWRYANIVGNRKGLARFIPLGIGIAIFAIVLPIAIWLAIATQPKSWSMHVIVYGSSILCTAAVVDFGHKLSKREWSEASLKGFVALGAVLTFFGVWAPFFEGIWTGFNERFPW